MARPEFLPDMLESVNRILAIPSHLLFWAQSEQKEVAVLKIRNPSSTLQPDALQDRLRSTLRSGHISGLGNKYCRVLGNIRCE